MLKEEKFCSIWLISGPSGTWDTLEYALKISSFALIFMMKSSEVPLRFAVYS